MNDELNILANRKDDLSQSIVPALRSDPEEMARYQRLSKATGIDPYQISEDPEVRKEAEVEVRRSAIDLDLLVKSSPSTSRFLSTPENADVAHDDVENLTGIEKASKVFFNLVGATAASVAGGVNPFLSEEDQQNIQRTVGDTSLRDIGKTMLASARGFASGPSLLLSGLAGAAETVATFNQNLLGKTALGDAYGLAAILAKKSGEENKAISDTIQGPVDDLGPIGRSVVSGVQSLGMMLPLVPFGAPVTLGSVSTAVGGLTGSEALKKGATPNEALVAGMIDGLVEFATEKLSFGPLEDLFVTRDLRKSVWRGVSEFLARDALGEQVATALQDANAQLLVPNDKTWRDYWRERPEAAFQTLIATIAAGGAVYGLSRTLRVYDTTFGDTAKAMELYKVLADETGKSKLSKRSPEKLREFVKQLRDDTGGVPDIYIDATKFKEYFESVNLDPAVIARDLGVPGYMDAVATGGDIVIPIQNFLADIAPTEHRAPLERFLRFRPQDMSLAEVEETRKEEEARIEEVRKQIEAQRAEFEDNDELQQIYQEFYDQQIAAGEVPSAADARAVLVASRYAARAAQLEGSSPLDLWREDAPISVVRESERDEPGAPENVPPGETTNNTDRATPDPRSAETGSDIAAEPAGAPPRPARVPLSPVDRRPPYVAADVGGIADDGMIPQEVLDAAPTIADGILPDAPGIDDSDSDVPQEVLDAAPSIASGIVLDTTEGVGTPPRETRVPRISDPMLPPDRTAISKEEAYMLLFAAGRVSEQQTDDDTGNITLSQSAQVRLQRMRNQKDVSKSEAAFIAVAGQFIDDYDRSVGNSNVPLETVAAAFLATADERIPKINFDEVVARIDRMPRQAQELYKSGSLGKLIEVTENQRRQDILDYIRFFRENSSLYTPVEAAAIIAVLSRQTIIYDAGKKAIVRASFSATSFSLPSPMNAAIAARAVEQMRAGVPVAKAIAVGVEEWATTKSPYPRNGWVRFAQSSKSEDIDALMQACSSNTGGWCTASSKGHATEQLTNGDFYVYFREGVASIAIRMHGPDVLEVSGGLKGQHLKPEDYPLLEEHSKRNPSLKGLREVILDAKRYRLGLESIETGVISPTLLAVEIRRSTEDGSTILDVLGPRYHRLHSRYERTPLFSEAEREALDALRRPTLEEVLQSEEVDSVTVSYGLSAAPLFPNLHTVYTDVDGSIENFPVLRRAGYILYKGTFEQDEVHVPLEWVKGIEFSGVGETAIHFDNLEVLEDSIQGAPQAILKFPKLRVAPRLRVERNSIENFPMLEEAQYVELDERVVPPNLRRVKLLRLRAMLDGVFTLPNLESVEELFLHEVERVSMPSLTNLEHITNNTSTDTVVHVPKIKTIGFASDEVILDAESLEELHSYSSEDSKTPIENLPSLWKVGYLETARPIPQIREARTVKVYEGGSLPNLETARELVVERGAYPANLREVRYLTLDSAGTADMRNLTTPPAGVDISATIGVNAPEGVIGDVKVKSGASFSTKGTIKYATLGRDCKIEAVGIEYLAIFDGGNGVVNAEIAEIAIYDLPANLTTTSERIKTVSPDPEVTEVTISGPKTFDRIYKVTGTLTLPDAETVDFIQVPDKLDAPKLTAVSTAYFDDRSGSLPPAITELYKLITENAEVHRIKKVQSIRSTGSVFVDLEEITADEERAILIDTVAPKLRKVHSGDFRNSKVPVLDQVDHIFSLATEFPALKTAKSVETTRGPIPNKFPVLESISNHLISKSDNDEFPALWNAGSVNSEATLPALRFVAGNAVLYAPAPVLERVGEDLVAANRSFVPDNVVVGGVFTVDGKRFNQSARTRLLTVSEKIKNLTDGLGAGDLFAARAFLESVPGFVDRMDRGDGTKTIEELAKEYLDYGVYEKLSTPSYATTVKNIEKAPHAVIEEYYAGNLPKFLENLRDSRDEQFDDIVDDVQSLVGPVEAAAILSRLVTDSYVYDRANRRVRTSPLKSSYTSPTSLPKKAILRTAELIRSGVPANKAIATALQEDVESASYPDGWNTFKRSKDTADAENLFRLAATSRGEWGTGQNVQVARSQLMAGDFHIYVKDGEAQVAIRMAGDKIAELAGSSPGQLLVEDDRELFKTAPVEVSEEAIVNQMAGNRQLRNLAVEFAREGTLPEEHSIYFMRKDGVLRRSVSDDMLPDTMDKKSPFYTRLQELHSTEVDPDTIDEIPYLIALEGATISEKILQKTKTLEAYKGVRVEGSVENIPTVYGWMSDANTFGFSRSSFMPSSWRLESLREDRTLNQSARTVKARTLQQGAKPDAPRAQITFRKGVRQITLFDGADLSSILHELGHTWLEELRKDALRENASAQLKEDWATLAEALGISEDKEIPTNAHEQFARWSERYLLEGNSPSAALRGVFMKFKHWLLRVYRTADELGAEIPEKVREVFDRLLATKEEIDAARADHAPMFNTPEQAGMTQAEWEAYRKLTVKERALAEQHLHQKILGDLRREDARWWKAAKKKATEEATKTVRMMPVYRAIRELATNKDVETGEPTFPLKLNRQALVDRYGKDILKKLSPASLKSPGWIYQEEGIDPENIAMMYDFDSGDALISAILEAQSESAMITELTNKAMLEQFGDPTTYAAMSEAANEAIANEARDQLLEMELKILRRRKREMAPFIKMERDKESTARKRARELQDAPVPAAILTSLAAQEISAQRVRDVSPRRYLKAAERAGARALKAATAGKYDQAAEFKQQQIVNMYLYKEAVKAVATAEKDVRYLKRVSKRRAAIGKAGQEWLDAVDSILAKVSIISASQNQLAHDITTFAEMVKAQTGEDLPISPVVAAEAGRQHYSELSSSELHGVADTIRAIEKVARDINKVQVGEEKRSIEETVRELVETGRKNIPNTRPLAETEAAMGIISTTTAKVRDFWNSLIRPEKLFERLDGGTSGIWHRVFWDRFAEAEHVKLDLMASVTAPFFDYQQSLKSSFDRRLNEMVYIKGLGRSIQRRTAIGVALNSGNTSNLYKLINGGIWFAEEHVLLTTETVAEILDTLSKEDWNLVELLWKSVDTLFPHLDALNRKVVGLPLTRVPATPIYTKYGKVSGGYWPAVADPRHNTLGEIAESPSTHKMFPTFSASAATKHSFREERTGAVYPLDLNWAHVFTRHVDWATTDIAYHEAARDASNLLRKPAIRKLIQNRFGENAHRALQEWVVHQTNPQSPKTSAGSAVFGVTSMVQSNIAVMALGYKVALAGANAITAPIQSFHQLSPLAWAKGVLKVMSAPNEAIEAMYAMSGEMRHHTSNMYAAINDTINAVQGKYTYKAWLVRNSMAIHQLVEKWTSATIWYGKYIYETERGTPSKEAIRLADKVIRTTQMAGAAKDVSAFERDPLLKVYTQFLGPLIVLQNEMRNAVATKSGGLGFSAKSLLSPHVFMTYMTTMVVPAVLFEIIAGRGPDDEDDPQAVLEWIAARTLLAPLQMVPLIREAAATLEAAITGESPRFGKSNPVADVIGRVASLPAKVLKDSATAGDWVDAAFTSIGVFGLPTAQPATTLQFVTDIIDGRYEPEGIQDLRYLLIKRDRRED